ncbi:MAG: translation initiation factor IF-2 [Dehalococcoidia bacterium]|nr:MAG: translation initiation factor IF-2 [Dehalococcoidia bacterium]
MPRAKKPDNTVEAEVEEASQPPETPKSQIELPHSLSVRQLADLLQVSAVDIIKQLMRKDIMANINQAIDYDIASEVATSLNFETRLRPRTAKGAASAISEIRKRRKLQVEEAGNLQPRPPVVTVMGHVDHGKTRLLDAIRQTDVMATEAGAITQHIGAYQVKVDEQKITFLDTPGHEAFTAMRAHGAQITDIIILVVAADDGIMPQTVEAINHARAAEVPIIVALNKIDKPEADQDRVKQQLAEAGLVIEEWGGDIVCVPISAKEKIGIQELLENLLVVAEVEELKANPAGPASGVVVEAEMDRNRGPLATILVNSGTLKPADTVVVGGTWGRVRAMFNDLGKQVKKAGPATPVEIMGLDSVPQAGDILTAVASEQQAQSMLEKHRRGEEEGTSVSSRVVSLHDLYDKISSGQVKGLNVILKADVQGSIEPIRSSLELLSTNEVQVRIIHSGTGNVSESDVMLATASHGLIIGFGVGTDEGARRQASTEGIDIRHYDVIYNVVDDVEKALKGLLEPELVEVIEGHAEVRAIFSAIKGVQVAGIYVLDGKVSRNSSVRVRRGEEVISDTTVSSLRRFKDDVREVATGYECGISVKDFDNFQVGDLLEFYRIDKAA